MRTELPIKVAEVHAYVLNSNKVDEIEYFEVDADPHVWRGQYQLIDPIPAPYCSARSIARISFSTHLPPFEKRLVIVKELLHVFDDDNAKASTEEAVDRLIAEIVAPQSLAWSAPGANDHLTEILALAVLLPKAAVDVFRPAVEANLISPEEVATIARVPERYGRFVFSEMWKEILDAAITPEVAKL